MLSTERERKQYRKRANKLIRVYRFEQSLAFYLEQLEFSLVTKESSFPCALVKSPFGQLLLIAADGVEGKSLAPWLEDTYDAPAPWQTVYFEGGPELARYKNRLLSRIPHHVNWEEKEWGWETLVVSDPDQYVLSFVAAQPLSDEELLRHYEAGPERLQQALDGLQERDLNLFRAPEKWSIRQIVYHVVDTEAVSLAMVKFALAEPGRPFALNPYDPEAWAERANEAARPISAEVALFTAIRAHVASLLRHVPEAMERTVKLTNGETLILRDRIHLLAAHALHHIEQIWETRKLYKK